MRVDSARRLVVSPTRRRLLLSGLRTEFLVRPLHLSDDVVIFGEGNMQRVHGTDPTASWVHSLQLELLRKNLPRFHNLMPTDQAENAS